MRPSDWSLIREIKVKGNDSSTSPWGLQLCSLTGSSLFSQEDAPTPRPSFFIGQLSLTLPFLLSSVGGTALRVSVCEVGVGWGGHRGVHAVLGGPVPCRSGLQGQSFGDNAVHTQLSFRSVGSELSRSPRKSARKCFMLAMA